MIKIELTCKLSSCIYRAKSLGCERNCVIIRKTCCSTVINAGGKSPCIPKYCRSYKPNAIP